MRGMCIASIFAFSPMAAGAVEFGAGFPEVWAAGSPEARRRYTTTLSSWGAKWVWTVTNNQHGGDAESTYPLQPWLPDGSLRQSWLESMEEAGAELRDNRLNSYLVFCQGGENAEDGALVDDGVVSAAEARYYTAISQAFRGIERRWVAACEEGHEWSNDEARAAAEFLVTLPDGPNEIGFHNPLCCGGRGNAERYRTAAGFGGAYLQSDFRNPQNASLDIEWAVGKFDDVVMAEGWTHSGLPTDSDDLARRHYMQGILAAISAGADVMLWSGVHDLDPRFSLDQYELSFAEVSLAIDPVGALLMVLLGERAATSAHDLNGDGVVDIADLVQEVQR